MRQLVLGLGLVALAVLTAACSGTSAAPPSTGDPATSPVAPAGDGIVVVAKDLAFGTSSIEVKAGEPVTIVLDNQEAAPHNIAIDGVFKGEIVSNAKATNAIPALEPGTYTFYCEVHPDMTGTITAD